MNDQTLASAFILGVALVVGYMLRGLEVAALKQHIKLLKHALHYARQQLEEDDNDTAG